jgi:hypothetical protein
MKKQADANRHILYRITTLLVIVFILISCEPFTTVPGTTIQQTSEIPQATPYPLPAVFQASRLNPLDTPHTYIQDYCVYLMNKWNRLNAEPGTVVMIIMLNEDVQYDLDKIMEQLHTQGFRAINTQQFLAFMERNIKIPRRSVLIIQDNSHSANDYNKKFREYWDKWGWTIVNGWVSEPKASESLWRENIALENEGWVDHQAQGVIPGTLLSDDSSKTVISRELKGPITAFAEQFAKNPIAFIWPGGGFGQRPVEAARELGYQLGFTSNSRGPVMYDWIPLADEVDPARPTYIPEGTIKDPLMTLPRYAPDQVLDALDVVRITGDEAKAYAQANKAVELEYYNAVCEPVYGRMPTP